MSLEPIPGQPGLFRSDKGEIINIRDFREGPMYSTTTIPIYITRKQLMKQSKKSLADTVMRMQKMLEEEREVLRKTHEAYWEHEMTLRALRGTLRLHFEKGDRTFDRTLAEKITGPGGEQLIHELVLLVIERLEAERLHSREMHRTTFALTRVLKPTPVPPERG